MDRIAGVDILRFYPLALNAGVFLQARLFPTIAMLQNSEWPAFLAKWSKKKQHASSALDSQLDNHFIGAAH